MTRRALSFILCHLAFTLPAAAATFNVSGTTLAINLTAANESVAITAGTSNYSFALTGGTWSGTDSADATGNGTATLSALKASFTAVTVDDGSTGNAVTFNTSGANTYDSSFTITLDAATAGTITFNGNTAFAGSAAFSASTSRDIVVASGAVVSVVNGNLTLSANQQVTPTAGTFAGVLVSNGVVQSLGAGVVSVAGRGGNTGALQFGVQVAGTSARIQSTSGNVTVTGTGGASDSDTADGLRLESGGKITTASNGSLTIVGTGGAGNAATAVSHVGVRVFASEISTVDGALSITGTGGAPTSSSAGGQYGIVAAAAAQIKATGNGTLTLDGRGGGVAGSGFNEGVQIVNSGTLVTVKDGQLTITGTYGAGSGGSALDIDDFGSVTSTGTGNMLLQSERSIIVNTGAVVSTVNGNLTLSANQQTTPTSASFVGVRVVGTVSSTGSGNVFVRGKGGTTASNFGINVSNGTISGGTAGSTVTVTGTGGGGAGNNYRGVTIGGATATITSRGGNVIVDGTGGGSSSGSGTFCYGVDVRSSSTITAGGSGTVTVTGTGGLGSGAIHLGVHMLSAGTITSSGGQVSVTGTGGQIGAGVSVNGGTITAGGTVNLTIVGTGTGGGTSSHGVFLTSAATSVITSGGGNVSITGTASPGAGASDIFAESGSRMGVGGSGTLTINADSIGLDTSVTPAAINVGANTLSLRQRTTGTAIDLGGLDALGTPNTLGLTDAELDLITAGTVQIGNANSGAITVSAVISPANYKTLAIGNNVTFAAAGGFSADVGPTSASYEKIEVTGTVTITPGASLALAATGGYVWNGTDSFTLLANDASDAIVGTFTGPTLANFLGSALSAAARYTRGTGNDLVAEANTAPTVARDAATVTVPEGTAAFNSGAFADANGDTVTITASVGTITQSGAGTWNHQQTFTQGGNPIELVLDSQENLYVANPTQNTLYIYNSNGSLVTSWTVAGTPTGVAVDSANGWLYVVLKDGRRIDKFTLSGTLLTSWGSAGSGDGQFNLPHCVAVDAAGDVYVADSFNSRIQVFSPAGTFLRKWGSAGSGDGQFNFPQGLRVSPGGTLYVADRNNNRVQYFNTAGTFLGKWGSTGSGDGQFNGPAGIGIDPAGNVVVGDHGNNRIQRFTATGTFMDKLGPSTTAGNLSLPHGAAFPPSSRSVYIADFMNGRVVKFATPAGWSWSYTPADNAAGPATVTITTTDSFGAAGTTTFTLNVNNVAPTIALTGNATVASGTPYTLNLGAMTDPGTDTVSAFSINWGDGNTENFTGNPASTAKTHTYATLGAKTITVTLTDEDSTVTGGTRSVTVVNTPPTFSVYSLTTKKNTAAAIGLAKLLALAADPDGGTPAISAVSTTSSQGGSVSLTGSSVTYTPFNNFTGLDTFNLTIIDGQGGSVTGTVTVNVSDATGLGGNQASQIVLQPGGEVSLLFFGIPGQVYQIQRSTDMSTWTFLQNTTAAADGSIPITDPSPPPGAGFYRTVVP